MGRAAALAMHGTDAKQRRGVGKLIGGKLAIGAVAGGLPFIGVILVLFAVGTIGAIAAANCAPAPTTVSGATQLAQTDIPPDYLQIYQHAGQDLDINWQFLASIGKQESNHGRSPAAARVNSSGCAGPMQLGTGGACGDFFGTYKIDGNHDGVFDVYNPVDAIYTAANGLKRGKGAPGQTGSREQYRQAACGYYGACRDKSANYADEVISRAEAYGATWGDTQAATVDIAVSLAGPVDGNALDGWISRQQPRSPLIGLGEVFVQEASVANLDPRLLVAIARQETSLGTTGHAAAIHNPFGMGPGINYPTWEDGISAAAENLARNYVATGLVTIVQIGAKWAPAGAANDPSGLNNNWVSGVSRAYQQMGGDPTAAVMSNQVQAASATGCGTAAQQTGDGTRQAIVAVLSTEGDAALSEVGFNCGPPLERYLGRRCGPAWCAIFTSWVWRQAGVSVPVIAYTGDFIDWSRRYGEWKPNGGGRPPEPGDVVLYDREPDGHYDHVNMVEQVLPDGRIVMVGGNTTGINGAGDGVRRKSPHDWASDPTIAGFASPIPQPL